MTVFDLIDRFLTGDLTAPGGADEAAWHTYWLAEGLGFLPPAEMAVQGGLAAQSLPQVFVAGYQAALHTVFPDLPAEGWAAFVAAEDQSDPERFPGTVLSPDSSRISGFKSWVGQSRHVRHLMVTTKLDGAVRVVRLRADGAGVSLTHRDGPRFLSGLSQGFAAFDDAPVDSLLRDFDIRLFGQTEQQFVMLAGAAFLAAQAAESGLRDRALALVAALAAYCDAAIYAPKAFAALDRELTSLADAFNGEGIPDWQADRRLLSMYSPRIQKRV